MEFMTKPLPSFLYVRRGLQYIIGGRGKGLTVSIALDHNPGVRCRTLFSRGKYWYLGLSFFQNNENLFLKKFQWIHIDAFSSSDNYYGSIETVQD